MSLNNIILSPLALSSLYRKSLVELDEAPIASERPAVIQLEPGAMEHSAKPASGQPQAGSAEPAAALQYLGKNLKNIVLLVHYPEQAYLPEEQLNFLTAILNACKLNMGDIAILNNARQQTNMSALKKELSPRQVVMFGEFNDIISGIEPFSITDIGGIAVLASPILETLNNTTDNGKILKGKLWGCLKQLFNV